MLPSYIVQATVIIVFLLSLSLSLFLAVLNLFHFTRQGKVTATANKPILTMEFPKAQIEYIGDALGKAFQVHPFTAFLSAFLSSTGLGSSS